MNVCKYIQEIIFKVLKVKLLNAEKWLGWPLYYYILYYYIIIDAILWSNTVVAGWGGAHLYRSTTDYADNG